MSSAGIKAKVKEQARQLGADLVGVCSANILNETPPDPGWPQTPARIWDECKSVIVLAKHIPVGIFRAQDLANRLYIPQLVMNLLDRIALGLSYWLEEQGYEAFPMAQQLTDTNMKKGTYGPLSLRHVAVEAGLGSLGLNLMLVTREYGPRVYLTAVMTDAILEPDEKVGQLCPGPSCGLCLLACPADAVEHWGLNKRKCATYAQRYGASAMLQFLRDVVALDSVSIRQQKLGGIEMVNYWQALRSGAGAYGACLTCFQVCPIGEDRTRLRKQVVQPSDERRARIRAMREAERRGEKVEGFDRSRRWLIRE